jgi:hypothetical protein
VAAEFIDFYEALDLPLEADRERVRARIGEVYLEAQRNLDHRNFQTRIRYQELFEVVLPRARYILLDEARRQEYDELVRALRGVPLAPAPAAPSSPADAPGINPDLLDALPGTPAFGRGDASGFRLAEEQSGAPVGGQAPRVEGLPLSSPGGAQTARQREEMLQQWRARLEAAIARDEQEQAAPKPASPQAPQNADNPAPRKPRAPAKPANFDFGTTNAEEMEEEIKQKQAALAQELHRTERKREAIKEILMGVGVKAVIIGSMGAAFPLGGLLIYLMGRFYPRGAAPQIALPSNIAWMLGLTIVSAAAYAAAYYLSRAMRHKKALELAMMSLEDILRELGRSY